MSLAEIGCWTSVVLCCAKLIDAATLYAPMVLAPRRIGDPLPEAVVFRYAARHRRVAPLADTLWRAPTFLVIAVPVTFAAAGHTEGWLLITTAALAVSVAINPVTTLLVGATFRNKFSPQDVLALVGFHYHRAGKPAHEESDAMSAVPTIIGAALGYFAAFGTLYSALSYGSHRAFVTAGAHASVARLDWIEALFFSVTTGSTLGDANVRAVSVAARGAVVLQVVATGAAVTLYAAFLLNTLVDDRRVENR